MDWVDVAIVVIVVASIALGGARGLIVEVGSIVGAVGGLFLARHEYKTAESFLSVFFHKDAHLAMAAFVLVFIVVWMLVSVIAQMIRGAIRFTPFGWLDRIGGGIIGLALGILSVEVLLLLAQGTHDHSMLSSIHHSKIAGPFEHALPGLHGLVPRHLPGAVPRH